MPSNCEYKGCISPIKHTVSTLTTDGREADKKSYCSEPHLLLGVMETMLSRMKGEGSTAIQRLYKTAVAVVAELTNAVNKEWEKTK